MVWELAVALIRGLLSCHQSRPPANSSMGLLARLFDASLPRYTLAVV